MSKGPFDPHDPEMRAWVEAMNLALDDVHALVKDMMRKERKRHLGPAKHRELYEDYWEKIMALMGRDLPKPPKAH